jgi:Rod binding domain-containing protein
MPTIQSTGASKVHASQTDERSKVKLQNAARDFESLFVGYMLKTMRSTVDKDSVLGEGFGGEMMQGMFDVEMARHLSRNSSFGIANMLYKQMTGEPLPNTMIQHSEKPVPVSTVNQAAAKVPAIVAEPTTAPVTPEVQPAHEQVKTNTAPVAAEVPVPVPAHASTIDKRLAPFEPIISEAAEQHGISASLLKAVIASESSAVSTARSSKSAKGLMQLIDSTAADMGVKNVWDPKQNIFGGAKYLGQLLDRFDGNLEHALASYNAGPGAVEKHGGVPPYPETKAYVKKVMNYLRYFEQQGDGHEQK